MSDFATARQRIGGLKGVMRALGDAPDHDHKWASMSHCPFCQAKGKAGVFSKSGTDFFKCHAPGCCSGGEVMTEISYLAARNGLSMDKPAQGGASPAYEAFLKLAGCWQEKPEKGNIQHPTSNTQHPVTEDASATIPVEQGEAEDSGGEPTPPLADGHHGTDAVNGTDGYPLTPALSPLGRGEGEGNAVSPEIRELADRAAHVVVGFQSASVRTLQGELKIRPSTVLLVLEELERRGVVGPARTKAPREVLLKSVQDLPPYPVATGLFGGRITVSDNAAPDGSPKSGTDDHPGVHNGVGGASELSQPPPSKKSAATPEGFIRIKILDQEELVPVSPEAIKKAAAARVAKPVEEAAPLIRPGLRALREFYRRLTPTDVQMSPYLPDDKPLPEAFTAAVVKQLLWRPVPLLHKRGLTTATCLAAGLRANPRGNEELLLALRNEFDWEELVASGLWLEADRKRDLPRRPNTQYCGKGQIGKKPESDRRKLASGRTDNDDKWVWGWCEPVLIPYLDANGEVIKLRPHKGGAGSGTAAGAEHIYVPRVLAGWDGTDGGQGNIQHPTSNAQHPMQNGEKEKIISRMPAGHLQEEKFFTVVICEGEYKALAIWQTLGLAAGDILDGDEPIGVCALPGISYAKSVEMRAELEDWLLEVGCRRVIVAFDDEDKSDKPLRQRLDAQKYARYLAMDLARKLHVTGLVCTLPRDWRNARGKADWDGALAEIVN